MVTILQWWRHQMEPFSALLAICAGNSLGTGEFPPQRPVTRSFDVFFDVRPNKRLSKQWWGWWFKTPSCPLWRDCNADDIFKSIFFNENAWIAIKLSLKFATKDPINNIPALVQIMTWRRPGDKSLSEPMMVRLPTHMRHSANDSLLAQPWRQANAVQWDCETDYRDCNAPQVFFISR